MVLVFANLSITQQRYLLHDPLLRVVNQSREGAGAGAGEKPWPIPFLQARAAQKAAPATEKHRENTPEESVSPLQSTPTFLEKGQKCSQQTDVADWAEPLAAGRVYQSLCMTTYFRHAWIPSLGKKKRILSSISSNMHCQKKAQKAYAMLLTTYIICEFISPKKNCEIFANISRNNEGEVGWSGQGTSKAVSLFARLQKN